MVLCGRLPVRKISIRYNAHHQAAADRACSERRIDGYSPPDAAAAHLTIGITTMAWKLAYPLYLVPLEAGYVSVVEPGDAEPDIVYLAIFTSEQAADEFIRDCGIESSPRALRNPREFAWLLQSLREPVKSVAFDPVADSSVVESPWKVTIADLLANHVAGDYSPWNYPVFVIRLMTGFVCVEGSTSEGKERRAVGLFTRRDKAEECLGNCGLDGTIVCLDDLQQVRGFLQSIPPDITAVAMDPVIEMGHQSAQYCFSIPTLLEKYLVTKARPRK